MFMSPKWHNSFIKIHELISVESNSYKGLYVDLSSLKQTNIPESKRNNFIPQLRLSNHENHCASQ